MKAILHETQPFSNIELCSLYYSASSIIIESNENYQKRSLRNKYYILTSQGISALTIPLKSGKNHQMPIKDVQISYDENWSKIHLGTLKAAYGKSPYFEHYMDELESIFSKKHTYLFDFNVNTLQFILRHTKLSLEIEQTNSYEKNPVPEMMDYRNYGWSVPEKTDSLPLKYVQVWISDQEFYYNLSFLDILFCIGPESSSYLRNMNISHRAK